MINEISYEDLLKWKEERKEYTLVDVREEAEHLEYSIGGTCIPLGDIKAELPEINPEKPTIFYCKRGIRSQIAIQKLQRKMAVDNFYNLTGGILFLKNKI